MVKFSLDKTCFPPQQQAPPHGKRLQLVPSLLVFFEHFVIVLVFSSIRSIQFHKERVLPAFPCPRFRLVCIPSGRQEIQNGLPTAHASSLNNLHFRCDHDGFVVAAFSPTPTHNHSLSQRMAFLRSVCCPSLAVLLLPSILVVNAANHHQHRRILKTLSSQLTWLAIELRANQNCVVVL